MEAPRPIPPIVGDEADTFTPEIEKYEEILDDSAMEISNMGEPIYELDGSEDAMVMEEAESKDGMYYNQPIHILNLKNEFNLRQAIIYNAIIDRPYA